MRQELRDLKGVQKEYDDCPHCKKKDEKIERKDERIRELEEKLARVPASQPRLSIEEEHIEWGKKLPQGCNFAVCKSDGIIIENPNRITKFKTCEHCGANTLPFDSERCHICGKTSEEFDGSEVTDYFKSGDEDLGFIVGPAF